MSPYKFSSLRWGKETKNEVRKHATRPYKRASNRNHLKKGTAIFMPDASCLCVKSALKQRLINKSTPLVVVDRDQAKMKLKILPHLKMLGFKQVQPFVGELIDMNIAEVVGYFQRGGRVGYAYFDICGEYSTGLAAWLLEQQFSWFYPNARLCFTFANYRPCKVRPWPYILHDAMVQTAPYQEVAVGYVPAKVRKGVPETAIRYAAANYASVFGILASEGFKPYNPPLLYYGNGTWMQHLEFRKAISVSDELPPAKYPAAQLTAMAIEHTHEFVQSMPRVVERLLNSEIGQKHVEAGFQAYRSFRKRHGVWPACEGQDQLPEKLYEVKSTAEPLSAFRDEMKVI